MTAAAAAAAAPPAPPPPPPPTRALLGASAARLSRVAPAAGCESDDDGDGTKPTPIERLVAAEGEHALGEPARRAALAALVARDARVARALRSAGESAHEARAGARHGMRSSQAIDMMWLPYEPQCVWLDARDARGTVL